MLCTVARGISLTYEYFTDETLFHALMDHSVPLAWGVRPRLRSGRGPRTVPGHVAHHHGRLRRHHPYPSGCADALVSAWFIASHLSRLLSSLSPPLALLSPLPAVRSHHHGGRRGGGGDCPDVPRGPAVPDHQPDEALLGPLPRVPCVCSGEGCRRSRVRQVQAVVPIAVPGGVGAFRALFFPSLSFCSRCLWEGTYVVGGMFYEPPPGCFMPVSWRRVLLLSCTCVGCCALSRDVMQRSGCLHALRYMVFCVRAFSPLSDILLCCLGWGAGLPPSQVEKWDTLREEGRFPGPE